MIDIERYVLDLTNVSECHLPKTIPFHIKKWPVCKGQIEKDYYLITDEISEDVLAELREKIRIFMPRLPEDWIERPIGFNVRSLPKGAKLIRVTCEL